MSGDVFCSGNFDENKINKPPVKFRVSIGERIRKEHCSYHGDCPIDMSVEGKQLCEDCHYNMRMDIPRLIHEAIQRRKMEEGITE